MNISSVLYAGRVISRDGMIYASSAGVVDAVKQISSLAEGVLPPQNFRIIDHAFKAFISHLSTPSSATIVSRGELMVSLELMERLVEVASKRLEEDMKPQCLNAYESFHILLITPMTTLISTLLKTRGGSVTPSHSMFSTSGPKEIRL